MKNLSYEEFLEFVSKEIIEKFKSDEMKYGDGDLTSEQYYYSEVKWYSNQVKRK